MKTYSWIMILCLTLTIIGCSREKEKKIEASVHGILERYPEATLRDLYKSFFQDYFGPGHLITDTAAAMNYLNYELSLDDYRDTVLLEKTGYHGNFYRVNLSLLKDGIIPKDTFFHYFLESVHSVEGISVEKWKNEWADIQGVIDRMSPDLKNYEDDRIFLDSLLSKDAYVVHHSENYINSHAPHYRIIHKKIFDDRLRRYIR